MTYAIWFCIFLSVGYFFSSSVAFLSYCRPVSTTGHSLQNPVGGRCVFKIYPFLVTQATVNMATDVLILVVPIPILWNLQMTKTTENLTIRLFFWLEECVLSLDQVYLTQAHISQCLHCKLYPDLLHYLPQTPYDYTWVIGNFYLWSSIEPSIGILCACLPTLYPLLRSIVARISGNSLRRYSEALRNQDTASKRIYIGRQRPLDWDETLLTTHDVQVEMSGTRRDNAQDRHITVDTEFRIVEESNQLK
jgi:hypothetical protein